MTIAFVFPGQGSQAAGMGRDLFGAFSVARDVFTEVDDALSQHLSRLMFDGPEADLTLTENAQPAIMAVSMAVLRVLEKEMGVEVSAASYLAGHSLGEYSALCASGSFMLAETARLLKLRGQAMQRAVAPGEGAMAAILGLELAEVEAIADDASENGEVVAVANDNSPGQVVVSGTAAGVDKAMELAKAKGAKRAVLLSVSAPFHSPLMQTAADAMRQALAVTHIRKPSVPIVTNVTAQAVSEPEHIRRLLVDQVCGRVRWRESVLWMRAQGVHQLVELGAGKVLTGLAKRIEKDIEAVCLATPQDLEAYAKL
jgi:[acyl-carrier-protein] S-malonyltransferase